MAFPPYLAVLLAGVLCGVSFVAATFRVSPPRLGVWLHVAGAIVGVGGVGWAIHGDLPDLSPLPEPLRHAVLWLRLGIAPMFGWIWLALLGRISSYFQRDAQARAATMTRTQWRRDGAAWTLCFPAVPMRTRTLVALIASVTVIAGGLAVAGLITFYDATLRIGAYGAILIFALVVGMPGYLALTALLRRGTETVTLRIDAAHLTLEQACQPPRVFALRELTLFRWQTASDHARLELTAPGVEAVSLLAGVARVPRGTSAELPALPPQLVQWLTAAGLRERPVRVAARPRTFARD
ncbi:hypothetical protein MNO14_16405 [Luteimonas sp. S4-F44]|uniref:hypothetical protein n=1 Tax=Luteimonas sp. S4-F44 TaxID=2925842 RepID=UPI001F52FB8C|nr:hypothetical protein [Luteimonas sp. S4-F44]UNK42486.1 hypothetical protein MNO14_16405 [Luteimonas sp. S4-F44]